LALNAFKPYVFPDKDMSQKFTRASLGILLRIHKFYPLAVSPHGMLNELEKFSHVRLMMNNRLAIGC